MAGPKAKTAQKNKTQKVRMLDGKVVKPVLYDGGLIGEGKYMAALVDDKMVLDANGKPKQFRHTGKLV